MVIETMIQEVFILFFNHFYYPANRIIGIGIVLHHAHLKNGHVFVFVVNSFAKLLLDKM